MASKKKMDAEQRRRDREAKEIGKGLLQSQSTTESHESRVMKLINDVGALGTFIPDDIITMAAEVLEKSESKASTFYINNFKPSVQQLYLSEEASTIDHGYLEEDKPSINFLIIDHHWLTVLFQPDSKPLITIYDSLATPERKYSVLPLLRKMYRNIGEGDVQYAPITQQGDDPACAAYAVAVAIEILRGRKPEQKQFDCSKMREHLMKILQQKKSLVFPTTGLRCLNCRPWQPVCKQHLFETTFNIVNGSVKGDKKFKDYLKSVACGVINGKTNGRIRIQNKDFDEHSKNQGKDYFLQQIEPDLKELSDQTNMEYNEVFSNLDWEEGKFEYFLIDIKGTNGHCYADLNLYEALHSRVDKVDKSNMNRSLTSLSGYSPAPQLSENEDLVLDAILESAENISNQYKCYQPDKKDTRLTDKSLINKLSEKDGGLRKYMSAFARQSKVESGKTKTVRNGGNFYAGVYESKGKEGKKINANETESVTKGTVYMVKGQHIDNWEVIEKGIEDIICDKMCWVTREGTVLKRNDIKQYYKTQFIRVIDRDGNPIAGTYVIEVAVAYFNGYAFASSDGPKVFYIASDGSVVQRSVTDWCNWYKEKIHEGPYVPIVGMQQNIFVTETQEYNGKGRGLPLDNLQMETTALQAECTATSRKQDLPTYLMPNIKDGLNNTPLTQNIQAGTVFNYNKTVFQLGGSSDQAMSKVLSCKEAEISSFLDAVKNFKHAHLMLVADHITPSVELQNLGLVPWTFIFDFDPDSRKSGLLSQVEPVIEKKRSLHITHWKEKCTEINDQSTHWMFLRGIAQQPDSKTDDSVGNWRKQVKPALGQITKQLKQFGTSCTNYYVVILWPKSKSIALQFKQLVVDLDDMGLCKFVIVRENEEESESVLDQLKDELSSNPQDIVHLGIDDVCKAVCRVLSEPNIDRPTKYALPTHDSVQQTDSHIGDREARWLSEGLDVLYGESIAGYNHSSEQLTKHIDEFLRGGAWPWYMWYATGEGYVDVERDIMKTVIESLKTNHINQHKSGIVKICHAPGSGGTVLAQRILWKLHVDTPCAQIKRRTNVAELKSRVEFLYNKTRLPVLLLVDGDDEQNVRILQNELRHICCIILYVQRYTYTMEPKRNSDNQFWLKRFVSKNEATNLAQRYMHICDRMTDKTRKRGVRMLEESVQEGRNHEIIEFGLAAYEHEYKGIVPYVSGFLQLEKGPGRQPLQTWQNALTILSLVLYYGQSSMPCKFFSTLFEKDAFEIDDLEDLPEEMQSLIVRETPSDEVRTIYIRINHYQVAKEILNQSLCRPNDPGYRSVGLCVMAKAELEPYAVDFIKVAGSAEPSSIIIDCMIRTFIQRDNKSAGETDLFKADKQRKAKFSQILDDVSKKAPYQERFNILEELTRAFPEEAEFHAHLGRLYSLCKPKEEKLAEECLEKAVSICLESTKGMPFDALDYEKRKTLMHVYHMYGTIFVNRVKMYSGRYYGDKPRRYVTGGSRQIEKKLEELFGMVNRACTYFTKCRAVTPTGLNADHGYLGEITIRLMLCDYICRNICEIAKKSIFDFIREKYGQDVSNFVAESIVVIDGLIIDCRDTVDATRTEEELHNLHEWYVHLFSMKEGDIRFLRKRDSIMCRRINIAARKYLYERKTAYGILEAVTEEPDIRFIVEEYEKIFEEVHRGNWHSSRQELDRDYKEWITAIRHKRFETEYSIETVLQKVRRWYEKTGTPSAQYYLFILCSLLGFGSGNVQGNTQLLIEAKNLREDNGMLKLSASVYKPKFPREWLGVGQGIRRLVHESKERASLQTMSGTIIGPNKNPKSGIISLDLGEDSVVSVEIFYIPVSAKMQGPVHSGKRVTFKLGFSIAHGYEAYDVAPIKNIKCTGCGLFTDCGIELKCPKCGQYIMSE